MTERTCTKCGERKPATTGHFNRHKRLGLRPDCRVCQKAAGARYREANRGAINEKAARYRSERRQDLARKQRDYHHANRDVVLAKMREQDLRAEYGLSGEQYAALLTAQGGGCALCGRHPRAKALYVDHDHVTGEVRGLLCPPCNSGVGALGDNVEGLERALAYLRSSSTRVAAVLPDGPAYKPARRLSPGR